MPDQIVEITQTGLWLNKFRGFIQINEKDNVIARIPSDDVLALIISTPGCSLSTVLIDELCQDNIPIVICGRNYLPSSFVLPVQGKNRQFEVMQAQVALSEPKRKRAWQTLVQAKIRNQAMVLTYAGKDATALYALANKTRSGDPENCEAQAARLYWRRLFGNEFRRDKEAKGINAALNYCYAIIRACIARAVVSAGLHPSFSLHHKNPSNPLNLVDDLIEPFRPMADCLVWRQQQKLHEDLSPKTKPLLSVITQLPVVFNSESSPLSFATVKFCRNITHYMSMDNVQLITPSMPTLLEFESLIIDNTDA